MVERQLDIFAGKRQRGKVVAPSPSEKQIHCAVADYLRNGLADGWDWFHPANGELRTDATGALLKRYGVKPGVSDILLHKAPHAQLHCLELKRKGAKPSDVQIAWMAKQEKIGAKTAWADSVDLAIIILHEWGAIRTSVRVSV